MIVGDTSYYCGFCESHYSKPCPTHSVATDYGDTSQFAITGEGRKPLDRYNTPAYCTELLYEVGPDQVPSWWWNDADGTTPEKPRIILEPCAGHGGISDVLVQHHETVITCDLDGNVDVMYPGVNVLELQLEMFGHIDCIVSNPPYRFATQAIRKMLTLTPNVAVLMRAGYLEDCSKSKEVAERRRDILDRISHVIWVERVAFIEGSTKCDSQPHVWIFFSDERTGRTWAGSHATAAEIARAKGQQELGI